MKRYTANDLEADVLEINGKLEKLQAKYRFNVGSAYNRTELDLCTPEQLARHCRQSLLETGTPRECLAAANAYLVSQIK